MTSMKAMILGCAGLTLQPWEVDFFAENQPWGFILFGRNIAGAEQLKRLTAELRASVGRDAPIFIDQEGGRVQRIKPPLAPRYPAAALFGALYARNEESGIRATWLLGRLHAFDLAPYGIDANCLPVLDVGIDGANDVIGDRAFAKNVNPVAILGKALAEGLMAGGVLPTMKHMPGHGRATADSHLHLPHVATTLDDLRQRDFVPFKALRDLPAAMTAHIVFEAIDPAAPATVSPKVISEIIRGEIGFDGLLMSDDVSMKALSGDFGGRAKNIIAAGCDLVLHCNGDRDEMIAVAENCGVLAGRGLERAECALAVRRRKDDADEQTLRAEFEALMGTAVA
ncbi:beta-N-acetylhexosaminidase [Limoniibacter endophyticus]|uniref:beta-N-acetylhexosaminidase n=1 Tax=Limoniibacter endophyticus TaxID=1565040 RepID=A0A8J3DJW3_9HYPH|nr:beta-N-acetylhexosaminidase [Limoniibacter endophyticus]GHC62843.1 beta-N-acetylhexosaminidase [Limoniibacter endophyticus]